MRGEQVRANNQGKEVMPVALVRSYLITLKPTDDDPFTKDKKEKESSQFS